MRAEPSYDQVWEEFGALDEVSPAARHRRRLVVELVGQHARGAQRVLDAGCGPGALLRVLHRALPDAQLWGVDGSETALSRARAACPRAQLLQFDLATAEHAAPTASFDLVICSEVLEHMTDDVAALRRLRALLAPNGRLIVTVPGDQPTRFDHAIGHVRHYTLASLTDTLEAADFRVERAFAWGFPFHSAYRALVRQASRRAIASGTHDAALGSPHPALALGYRLVAAPLAALYFVNSRALGPQLFAVARL